MEAGAIIAGLVTLLVAWVKWYTERDKTYEDLQVGRRDIEAGNTAAISERVDRLLASESGTADSSPGEPSAEDVEGQISKL